MDLLKGKKGLGNRELIKGTNKYKIFFDNEYKLIVWQPLGEMSPAEFRDGFIAGMGKREELFRQGVVVNWLNIVEKVKMVSIKDLQWLSNVVNLQGIGVGTKKVAFTKPDNLFGFLGVNAYLTIAQIFSYKIAMKSFENEIEAINWLIADN